MSPKRGKLLVRKICQRNLTRKKPREQTFSPKMGGPSRGGSKGWVRSWSHKKRQGGSEWEICRRDGISSWKEKIRPELEHPQGGNKRRDVARKKIAQGTRPRNTKKENRTKQLSKKRGKIQGNAEGSTRGRLKHILGQKVG